LLVDRIALSDLANIIHIVSVEAHLNGKEFILTEI